MTSEAISGFFGPEKYENPEKSHCESVSVINYVQKLSRHERLVVAMLLDASLFRTKNINDVRHS